MEHEAKNPVRPATWAYGYLIVPPLSPRRLQRIERLLTDEQSTATLDQRTWQARFVMDEQVTHLLVVSDSPDQRLEINRRMEAELTKLGVGFSLSPPVAVAESS